MCELTFITEIQDLQRKIPITVKLITREQAMWLKNGKMLKIESKKSCFNNNNILRPQKKISVRTTGIVYYNTPYCNEDCNFHVIYRMFQKSLYRKARYKNHLPLKYCITKMEFKATLARHVC
jgi:hypothetical protein